MSRTALSHDGGGQRLDAALSWRAWNSFSARTCTDLGGWTRRRSSRLLSGEIEWVKLRIESGCILQPYRPSARA
jgi:hypothetical protein